MPPLRESKRVFDRSSAAQIPEAAPGRYVIIAVEDTGEGMPPDVVWRATEPFFTTKEVGKGTGPGLSQVYGFARQSDGFLTIESTPGSGTTVRLYLPQADKALPAPDRDAPAEVAEQGSETILVVEDDADVRSFAVDALSTQGYRTLQPGIAAEALGLLRTARRVDLLFTDAVMPGGTSGLELAQEARRLQPGLKILFTSGFATTETRSQSGTKIFRASRNHIVSWNYIFLFIKRSMTENKHSIKNSL